MSVFITGATGFIGQYLARKLADLGYTVHALVRQDSNISPLEHPNIRLFTGNLVDPASIEAAIKGCTQVYHLAGFARAWHKDRAVFHDINVNGTRNVLDAALKQGITRVLAVSTAGVLPPAKEGVPVDESVPKCPGIYTEYERTKNKAEELARSYARKGLPLVIVNPTKVFGPGPVDESNSATLMIRNYIRGTWKIIPGNGKGIMDYVYVEDVAEGMRLAMEKGRIGEQYILGGHNISYDRFFDTVAGIAGVQRRLFKVPVPVILCISALEALKAKILGLKPLITPEWVRKIPFNWSKSSAKAGRELGYTARSFEEGVKLTIDWLRKTKQV